MVNGFSCEDDQSDRFFFPPGAVDFESSLVLTPGYSGSSGLSLLETTAFFSVLGRRSIEGRGGEVTEPDERAEACGAAVRTFDWFETAELRKVG